MAAPNSVPAPHEFSPREEVAWNQGVLTPFIAENESGAVVKPFPQKHPHKPHHHSHVRVYASDSDFDPEWNAPADPNVVPASPELKASLVPQVHAAILRARVARMAGEGASMKEIEQVISRHVQKYGQPDSAI